MTDEQTIRNRLTQTFATESLAVLCTHRSGQPYGSLVAFASADDLTALLFATTRATRKYQNIEDDYRVAMVIDTRSGRSDDFHDAIAVTATGTAAELTGADRDRYAEGFLGRHPHLVDFVKSPTCALLRVAVDTYYVVQRFQDVTELHIRPTV